MAKHTLENYMRQVSKKLFKLSKIRAICHRTDYALLSACLCIALVGDDASL